MDIKNDKTVYCTNCDVPMVLHSPTECGWDNAAFMSNPKTELHKQWMKKKTKAVPSLWGFIFGNNSYIKSIEFNLNMRNHE